MKPIKKKQISKKLKLSADTLRRLTTELSLVRGAYPRTDSGSDFCQTEGAIPTCPT